MRVFKVTRRVDLLLRIYRIIWCISLLRTSTARFIDSCSSDVDGLSGGLWDVGNIGDFPKCNPSGGTQAQYLSTATHESLPFAEYGSITRPRECRWLLS